MHWRFCSTFLYVILGQASSLSTSPYVQSMGMATLYVVFLEACGLNLERSFPLLE